MRYIFWTSLYNVKFKYRLKNLRKETLMKIHMILKELMLYAVYVHKCFLSKFVRKRLKGKNLWERVISSSAL